MNGIYNEGRVVGYSAYEIYARHFLEKYPGKQPASQKEWLSATLGYGSSMIIKIKSSDVTNANNCVDIAFPNDGKSNGLCAANTIIAAPFFGTAEFDDNDRWAVNVTDYGLIEQDKITDTGYEQPGTLNSYQTMAYNYLKIADGVILQPGTWTMSGSDSKFEPNFTTPPTIRLKFSQSLFEGEEIVMLLTGLHISSIVEAECGITHYLSKDHVSRNAARGDFLGPGLFPWASKVIFTTPSSIVKAILNRVANAEARINKLQSDMVAADEVLRKRISDEIKGLQNQINGIDIDVTNTTVGTCETEIPYLVSEVYEDADLAKEIHYLGRAYAVPEGEVNISDGIYILDSGSSIGHVEIAVGDTVSCVVWDTEKEKNVTKYYELNNVSGEPTKGRWLELEVDDTKYQTIIASEKLKRTFNILSSYATVKDPGDPGSDDVKASASISLISDSLLIESGGTKLEFDEYGNPTNIGNMVGAAITKKLNDLREDVIGVEDLGPSKNHRNIEPDYVSWYLLLRAIYEGCPIDVIGNHLRALSKYVQNVNMSTLTSLGSISIAGNIHTSSELSSGRDYITLGKSGRTRLYLYESEPNYGLQSGKTPPPDSSATCFGIIGDKGLCKYDHGTQSWIPVGGN